MDITALLSQNLAKTGATGQPAAADGEAFAGSLRDAAAKLLSASESDGASGEAALALLDAGGDRPLTGEASDALRNALEALAGSRLKTGDGDALPAQKAPLAELADAGVSEENAIRDLVEHAADNGAANPVTGGLAVPAPLTAAASKNTARFSRMPSAFHTPTCARRSNMMMSKALVMLTMEMMTMSPTMTSTLRSSIRSQLNISGCCWSTLVADQS